MEENRETAEWLFPERGRGVDVRQLAARVLGRSLDAEAVAALVEALGDADPGLRRDAATSLAEIASRHSDTVPTALGFDALAGQLDAEDRDLRVAVVRALGALGNPTALELLPKLLGDPIPAVRIEAVRALTRLVPTAGSPATAQERQPASMIRRFLGLLEDP